MITAEDIIDGEPTAETTTWKLCNDGSYVEAGDLAWANSFPVVPGDEPAGITLAAIRRAYHVIEER